MRLKDFEDVFRDNLRDPEFVQGYLQETFDDGLPNFLLALRDVIRANEGMSKAADQAQVSRESLYRALSEEGNPSLSTIKKVLDSIGITITFAHTPRK